LKNGGTEMKTIFNRIKRTRWISTLVIGIIALSGFSKAAETVKPKEVQVRNISAIQTLKGNWKLAIDPQNKGRDEGWYNGIRSESKEAVVPGVIQQVFPGYHGVAWYWLNFQVKCYRSPDDRLLVRFGSVDYLADVWINGKHAGSFEGGETPFELDITGLVNNDQDNLLAVRVLNPTNEPIDGITLAQTPHINKVMVPGAGSSFNSGGITANVVLRSVPSVYINDIFARPDVKTGSVMLTVTTNNSNKNKRSGTISFKIAAEDATGDIIQRSSQEVNLVPGISLHEFSLTVPEPRLWYPQDPFLYRVTAEVMVSGQKPHEQSVRCGFRDFRIVNGYFHINGKRIFLKSTHTGNHMPIGMHVPMDPDFVRRDIINAKACGFNTIRFIASAALPEQLDFCDEIGMMIIEESYASWLMGGEEGGYSYVKGLYPPAPVTPKLEERYIHSYTEMLRRDRNHPSVVVWQLLNETENGPMFDIAHQFLPKLRQIDPTRLVLLNSGRFDGRWSIGTASNPESSQWEHVWGIEDTNVPKAESGLGYPSRDGSGDFHIYPGVPQTLKTSDFIRNLGKGSKPVFLTEYGIGSLFNVIDEWKHFEQADARPDLEDGSWLKEQSKNLTADWKRLGFENVYPFVEDMLNESQRLSARQRTIGFNIVRSNPNLCGFNVTGMLDHGMTGEGLWKFWRGFKPTMFDAVSDGWSPLRWCLFVEPLHVYSGRTVTIEAVLANEDVLKPGEYHAKFRVFGPLGSVWEKNAMVKVPNPPMLAVPVIRETFELKGPAGQYSFAADLEEGGAATGGKIAFYVSDSATLPKCKGKLALWGIDKKAEQWLTAHGLDCHQLTDNISTGDEVILVGKPADAESNPQLWESLSACMAKGSAVVFLSGQIFTEKKYGISWLPLKNKGICSNYRDWLYHKECVTKRHEVFDDLQGPGIMDWDYYGPLIPREIFEGQDTPDETIAASFNTGNHNYPRGYGSGLIIAMYKQGKGRMILSTPYILENLDLHPAADRLLLNLVLYAQGQSLQKGK
jgi:hypothetical protein